MTDAADRLYERVLVLRCQTGDPEAFETLIGRHGERLRYYVTKMVRNIAEPDDVLQDIWLDVFRGLPGLSDADAFRGWLYRIARSHTARRLRGRRGHVPLDESAVGGREVDVGGFSDADAELVHAALDTLAPEHREALVLRFLEDMTYEEIAGVTGEPLGTVRSRLHYAKSALRRAIERTYGHE